MEWVAARRALKYLAWKMLNLDHAEEGQVVKDHFGVPRFSVARHGKQESFPCSLSHSEGMAAAALCLRRDVPVGVDVQRVTPKLVSLRQVFLSAGDRLGVPLDDMWCWTALWACKEAVAKALGQGLAVDLTKLGIHGTGSGRFVVRGAAGHEEMEGYFFMIPPAWVCSVVWSRRTT